MSLSRNRDLVPKNTHRSCVQPRGRSVYLALFTSFQRRYLGFAYLFHFNVKLPVDLSSSEHLCPASKTET